MVCRHVRVSGSLVSRKGKIKGGYEVSRCIKMVSTIVGWLLSFDLVINLDIDNLSSGY